MVGTCRSGKPVTSQPELDDLQLPSDIFDAMSMLDTLATREFVRGTNCEHQDLLRDGAELLRHILNENGWYESEMNKAGVLTAFDIPKYAQRLLRPEFRI